MNGRIFVSIAVGFVLVAFAACDLSAAPATSAELAGSIYAIDGEVVILEDGSHAVGPEFAFEDTWEFGVNHSFHSLYWSPGPIPGFYLQAGAFFLAQGIDPEYQIYSTWFGIEANDQLSAFAFINFIPLPLVFATGVKIDGANPFDSSFQPGLAESGPALPRSAATAVERVPQGGSNGAAVPLTQRELAYLAGHRAQLQALLDTDPALSAELESVLAEGWIRVRGNPTEAFGSTDSIQSDALGSVVWRLADLLREISRKLPDRP